MVKKCMLVDEGKDLRKRFSDLVGQVNYKNQSMFRLITLANRWLNHRIRNYSGYINGRSEQID